MTHHLGQRAVPAPYALPAGFAMFLAVGTAAAALHGRLTATGVLAACAAVAGIASFAAEPTACVLLAGIGWLTVTGFSRPPYAQLRPTGPAAAHAAVVLGVTALTGAGLGLVFRWYWRRLTLLSTGTYTVTRAHRTAPEGVPNADTAPAADLPGETASPPGGISVRRRAAGFALAAAVLPLLTVVLATARGHLNLADFVSGLPGCGGGHHGDRRLLARRARRRGGQPAAQLVLHRSDPHVHHRPAARAAGPAAVRDRRGRRQQRRPPGRPARPAGRPGPRGSGLAARAGADRAGRRRFPRGRARAPHQDPRRAGRTAGAGGRPVGAGRLERCRRGAGGGGAHRHPVGPDPDGHRARPLGHAGPAGRVRRPGGGRAGPGAAAHPGGPGRGAGRRATG